MKNILIDTIILCQEKIGRNESLVKIAQTFVTDTFSVGEWARKTTLSVKIIKEFTLR